MICQSGGNPTSNGKVANLKCMPIQIQQWHTWGPRNTQNYCPHSDTTPIITQFSSQPLIKFPNPQPLRQPKFPTFENAHTKKNIIRGLRRAKRENFINNEANRVLRTTPKKKKKENRRAKKPEPIQLSWRKYYNINVPEPKL